MINPYPYRLLIIVLLHFIFFCIFGIFRHWGYITSVYDLGCFDQATWSIIHKGFMLNSFGHAHPINWLGHHFNPILYLFAPLYYLIPSVNWFIVAQSAALSLAALPIFLLAKQVIRSENQAVLWSIVYLVNPFVLSADAWDFHPVSLAVPFITLAFLAMEQQKVLLFGLANITLLLCQEQFGLTVACFGLLYGIKNKEFRVSSALLILGVISIVVVLTVIMPSLSPTKQHIMFGEGNNLYVKRYTWLGNSPKEALKTLFFSPQYVFETAIFKLQGFVYLLMLFFPVLFTALAAPFFLLPMSADFLANILSEFPLPRAINSYHSVTMIPVITIAAIYACQKISSQSSLFASLKLSRYIAISTVIMGYLFAPFSLPFAANIARPPVTLITKYDDREDEIKSLVGSQSVSVQANIGAHFSQREQIYIFPDKLSQSHYVILWLSTPENPNDISILINYILFSPAVYLNEIEKLLHDKNFKIVYWNDPWLVFKREPKIAVDKQDGQVLEKINAFRKNLPHSAVPQ